jgi:PAS domain S-box-containing protein
VSPADEAAHLRQLLDRQPACMMRIGCDGALLAVNDASLRLLGVETLAQVLDTPLTDRLIPEHHELWRDFAARIWSDGSGSIECDMVDRSGAVRSVRFQAVALPDHPDGIRSMLVGARDLSSTRRLEQALQETEATNRVVEEVRAALVDAQSARDSSLAAAAESQRATEALREELERSLAEQRRMTDGIVQRDHDRRQIEAAIKRRDEESLALQSAIERYEAEHQRLEMELDRSLGESRRLQSMLEIMRSELDRAQAEVITTRTQIAEARAIAGAAHAERSAAAAELEEAREARKQAQAELASAQAEREAAQAELEQALAEHEEFQTLMKSRDVSRQKMLADHASARMQAERALAETVARHERLAKQIELLARECAPQEPNT